MLAQFKLEYVKEFIEFHIEKLDDKHLTQEEETLSIRYGSIEPHEKLWAWLQYFYEPPEGKQFPDEISHAVATEICSVLVAIERD